MGIRFDVARVPWPDQWKKSNRRNPVLCVLCKEEETKRDSGVCVRCERFYNVGVAYMKWLDQQKAEQDQVTAKLPDYPRINKEYALTREEIAQAYNYDRFLFEDSEAAKAIVGLANITPVGSGDTDLSILFPGQDRTPNYECSFALGERKTFMQLQKVFDLIRFCMKKQYQEGLRDGQQLLTRLAAGDLSVAQLNAFELKHGKD